MRFEYVAIEQDGREVKGFLNASSVRDAISILNEEGRIPVSATPAGAAQGGARRTSRRTAARGRLKSRRLPAFTRRLAQMTGAGVSIETALASLERSSPDDAAAVLGTRLREGESFADALKAYGAPFDGVYIALVRAGEASGELGALLERLAGALERARDAQSGIVSALIYPALLLLVSLIVFSILMLFVVPRFETLFADAGAALPLATQIVIGAARTMQAFWWAPLVLFIAGAGFLRLARDNEAMQLQLAQWRLAIPVIGGLISQFETARLTRTLGALPSNGVPAYDAVTLAAEAVENAAERRRARSALGHVRRGEPLSAAFAKEGVADDDFIEIIRVGETSGRLGPALLQAAGHFEENLTRRLKTIVAMVEPLIIMTLGVLIGGVVISLFVAILSVNDLAY